MQMKLPLLLKLSRITFFFYYFLSFILFFFFFGGGCWIWDGFLFHFRGSVGFPQVVIAYFPFILYLLFVCVFQLKKTIISLFFWGCVPTR
jgi:hypothetical protein